MTTRSVGIWHHRADEILADALMDDLDRYCEPELHEPMLVLAGSPLLIGDSIGPRIGDTLLRRGFPGTRFGDSEMPVSVTNAKQVEAEAWDLAQRIGRKPFLIVVDAAVGRFPGTVQWGRGQLLLGGGASVDRRHGYHPVPIGDLHIACFTARSDAALDHVGPDLIGTAVAVLSEALYVTWERYGLYLVDQYRLIDEQAAVGRE